MKNNNLNKETPTENAQETTAQGVHSDSAEKENQTKEALHKAAHTVENAYEKTAQKVGETYEKLAPNAQEAIDKSTQAVNRTYQNTREYSVENPGKAILVALGIGAGIGFIWGSNSRHSRGGRYARPIVNAVSDVALEFFR